MSKKKLALILAPILAAISTALYQCPDDEPARTGETVVAPDAGE